MKTKFCIQDFIDSEERMAVFVSGDKEITALIEACKAEPVSWFVSMDARAYVDAAQHNIGLLMFCYSCDTYDALYNPRGTNGYKLCYIAVAPNRSLSSYVVNRYQNVTIFRFNELDLSGAENQKSVEGLMDILEG